MSYYDTDGTDPPQPANLMPVDERASSLPAGELIAALNRLDGYVGPAMASLRVTARAGLAADSGQES